MECEKAQRLDGAGDGLSGMVRAVCGREGRGGGGWRRVRTRYLDTVDRTVSGHLGEWERLRIQSADGDDGGCGRQWGRGEECGDGAGVDERGLGDGADDEEGAAGDDGDHRDTHQEHALTHLSSTPVGPPPTTTMCNKRFCSSDDWPGKAADSRPEYWMMTS